ncbi:MAG TPA: glutamine amidotransferase, partial [bacterium]
VVFQATDDRVETPSGALVTVSDRTHPVMGGIEWEPFPPLLGYNRATPRPDARVLATVRPFARASEDPLIAVREYGRGRTVVFSSDTTPHWGVNFMKWPGYEQFFRQVTLWLAGAETAVTPPATAPEKSSVPAPARTATPPVPSRPGVPRAPRKAKSRTRQVK